MWQSFHKWYTHEVEFSTEFLAKHTKAQKMTERLEKQNILKQTIFNRCIILTNFQKDLTQIRTQMIW